MATDIIARGLAVSNSGGGGGSLDVGIEEGVGIKITGTDPKTISNDGVTNVTESAESANDGTIKVVFGNKTGTDASKNVAVKGLKNAAFTEKTTTIADATTASDTKLPTEKAVRTELNKKVNSSLVGDANGIATLDATKKLTSTQLPDHNHASDKINAMTGYTKPSTTSAIDASTDTLNSAIGKLEKALDTKQASGTYATGDASGNAVKANALSVTEAVGSTTQGVYIDANGKPQTMTYTLAQSVTANSKLTDTTYTQGNGIEISDANVIKNTGVLAVTNSPSTNPTTGEAVADGTFQVNTNGTVSYVGIKGLAASAYKGVDATVKSGSKNLVESDGVATAISTAVSTAVNALDATGASNIGASKTISAWSETDGIVSVTTQDIAINTGAVSIPQGYEKAGTASGIAVGDSVTDAFGKVEKTVDGKVDKTTTVNGKALSADVTLYGNNVKLKDGTYSKDTTSKTIDKDTTVDGAVAQIEYRLDKKANGTTVSSVENTTSTVTVPACLGYAGVKMVGGKSKKSQNLIDVEITSASKDGITLTNNGNGTYTVNGTATAETWFSVVIDCSQFYGKRLKLVGCPNNITYDSAYLSITDNATYGVGDKGSGVIFEPTSYGGYDFIVQILVKQGTTLNNALFKPMLTYDETATYNDFEPYGLLNGAVEKIVSKHEMIDESEYTAQYGYNEYGNLEYNVEIGYYKIPIVAGRKYTISGEKNWTSQWSDVILNESNNVISKIKNRTSGSGGYVESYEFIAPANSKYLCISVYVAYSSESDKEKFVDKDTISVLSGDETTISVPDAIKNLPDYGCSAGDVYNWVDFENGVYRHNVGSVVCDAFTRQYSNEKGLTVSEYSLPSDKQAKFISLSSTPNMICDKNISIGSMNDVYTSDTSLATINSGESIRIVVTGCTTIEQVNAAMANSTFYYELSDACKKTIPISAFIPPIPCEEGGTITLQNPHSLDVPNTIVYKEAK